MKSEPGVNILLFIKTFKVVRYAMGMITDKYTVVLQLLGNSC